MDRPKSRVSGRSSLGDLAWIVSYANSTLVCTCYYVPAASHLLGARGKLTA